MNLPRDAAIAAAVFFTQVCALWFAAAFDTPVARPDLWLVALPAIAAVVGTWLVARRAEAPSMVVAAGVLLAVCIVGASASFARVIASDQGPWEKSVTATWTLIPSLLVLAGFALASFAHETRRAPWLLAAVPFVAFAAYARAWGPRWPHPASVVAFAAALPLLLAPLRSGRRVVRASALVAVLVLTAIPALLLSYEVKDHATSVEWIVRVEPRTEGAYRVTIPLPTTSSAAGDAVVALMRGNRELQGLAVVEERDGELLVVGHGAGSFRESAWYDSGDAASSAAQDLKVADPTTTNEGAVPVEVEVRMDARGGVIACTSKVSISQVVEPGSTVRWPEEPLVETLEARACF